MRMGVWLCGAAAGFLVLVTPLPAAEEVDTAKVAERALEAGNPDNVDPTEIKGENWTFDFTFENPQPVVVNAPGLGPQLYWYLVYTVTNRTKAEHHFVPAFTLYATNTSLQRAGVYPSVFEAIKKQRKIRFLENAVQMIGRVLPGEDNARTGVAIFGPMPREAEHFTIFVEGLSGQYIERPNPQAKPDSPPSAKVLILRKTLTLTYKLPGDKWWLNQDPPIFAKKAWTWR